MEADEVTLEEGEIVEDNVSNYTPLERPSNYSALIHPNSRFPVIVDSESENELIQSSEDSDSDFEAASRSKKPKIKFKPKPQQPLKLKEKKYDIWSTRVQEDVLAETLNSCDVTKRDRSRDVESYDYVNHFLGIDSRQNRTDYDDGDRYNSDNTHNKRTKRSRDDRKNPNLRIKGRSKSSDKEQRGNPRLILDLTVNSESEAEDIAKDIANKLCEEKEDLILKAVEIVGKQKVFELFKETKRIEEEGGMLIMNQTRRRTPGGVFLFLLRHDTDITLEQKASLFDEEKQRYKMEQKMQKKKKHERLKSEIAKSRDKLLPDLLTRAELLVANENNRTRKETDVNDVINPPPTPETDHHENSGDGMDGNVFNNERKIESYDEDFLDIALNNTDMELL